MFFYLKLWISKLSPCQNRMKDECIVSAVNVACWFVETRSGRERETTRLGGVFFSGQYCRCIQVSTVFFSGQYCRCI